MITPARISSFPGVALTQWFQLVSSSLTADFARSLSDFAVAQNLSLTLTERNLRIWF